MRLSDITEPIEKDAAWGTALKYMLPKIKGVVKKEMVGLGKLGRGATTTGRTSFNLGKSAISGTFKAARRTWAVASAPYKGFGKMTLKGWDKKRNVARFSNPKFTGKGTAGSRLGAKGEFSGGTFIPSMTKQTVTRSQKAKHVAGRAGQFTFGAVPLFAGLGAAGELTKTRHPITSPYMR